MLFRCAPTIPWFRVVKTKNFRSMSTLSFCNIRSARLEKKQGEAVIVKGWVRSVRNQKHLSFIEVNDGSSQTSLQVIAELESARSQVEELSVGCSVEFHGTLRSHPRKDNEMELSVHHCSVIGDCDPDTYPLQKKYQSLEYLREHMHLRCRTNTLVRHFHFIFFSYEMSYLIFFVQFHFIFFS